MMPYSEHDLVRRLEGETSWRKKELQTLSFMLKEINDEALRATFRRAFVVLLYAHLEGSFREITKLFLRFLEHQELEFTQLKENFWVLLKPVSIELPPSQAIQDLLTQLSSRLNPKDFRRQIWLLGLNYEWFETKEAMLKMILTIRNKIAHGEKANVGDEELLKMVQHTRDHITEFENEIVAAARNRTYLKQS